MFLFRKTSKYSRNKKEEPVIVIETGTGKDYDSLLCAQAWAFEQECNWAQGP